MKVIQLLTEEYENGANPLHCSHYIAKQNNRAKDGEELPRSCDNGAGQRPKVHNCHEDEGLKKEHLSQPVITKSLLSIYSKTQEGVSCSLIWHR